VFAKASWAFFMARLHPFFDGNKRTAFSLGAIILNLNGYFPSRYDEDEIFEVLHKISDATLDCDTKRIEKWLKKKSRKWWKAAQRSIYDYL
jgi:death on curing protein